MSRPGTPSDNQPIESFWHILKVELPDTSALSFNDASRVIVHYIEMYYTQSASIPASPTMSQLTS